MDKKREFLERCGALEYESVFEGISLKEMLGMRVKKMNKLLAKIAKVDIRERIWKQLQEEEDSSDSDGEEAGGEEKRARIEAEEAENGVEVLSVGRRVPEEVAILSDDEDNEENRPGPSRAVTNELVEGEEEQPSSSSANSNGNDNDNSERSEGEEVEHESDCGIVQAAMTRIQLEDEEPERATFQLRKRSLIPRNSRSQDQSEPGPSPLKQSPVRTKVQAHEGMVHLKIIESHRESSGTPLKRPIPKIERRWSSIKGTTSITVSLTWAEWTSPNSEDMLPPEKIDHISLLWDYPEDLAPFEAKELPNLKRLEIIGHSDNYWEALQKIIEGADGNLERIDFHYKENNDACLLSFLTLMTNIRATYLKGLKILNLSNSDCEWIALLQQHFELLNKLKAQSLEELIFEFGIWEGEPTIKSFEEMLQNFASSLKKLVIRYCFVTDQRDELKVTLNFPKMPKLEELDLGERVQPDKVIENLEDRPKKKRLKQRFIAAASESGAVPDQSDRNGEDDEDYRGNYFSVTLNLPQMNRLKFIRCGFLYEIQDIHFSKFPKLETFLVASPWDNFFRFPGPNSRHPHYPKIQEVQLPNELQDPRFVSKALALFPNLRQCCLNLPSVGVIRALAKTLSDENPCPLLKRLNLRVRFDFASSLNAVILNEPWMLAQSTEELRKIRKLKEYSHWEEYVQINKIQIPNYEELKGEGKGLAALKDKLGYKGVVIEYVPRVLRLPQGSHHFNDDQCAFSHTLIGFDLCKMVMSKEAALSLPEGWVFQNFDTSLAKEVFRVRSCKLKHEGISVDPLQVTPKQEQNNNEACR